MNPGSDSPISVPTSSSSSAPPQRQIGHLKWLIGLAFLAVAWVPVQDEEEEVGTMQ